MSYKSNTRNAHPLHPRGARTFLRIPPAAPGSEKPITITKAEFDAALALNAFTRDQYVSYDCGMLCRSTEDVRLHRMQRLDAPPAQLTATDAAGIAATQAELVLVQRMLSNIVLGLDSPDLRLEACRSLQATMDSLAALSPLPATRVAH